MEDISPGISTTATAKKAEMAGKLKTLGNVVLHI